MTGRFVKGAWVEDPFEKIEQCYVESGLHLQSAVQDMADSMIEWNKHSGNFEKGAEITFTRSIEKIMEKFAASLLSGLSQSFK